MQITCLGAARTVTGSSYLVELEPGRSFLVDCGMFQGGRRLEDKNYHNDGYKVDEIQGIFITHAHIDHSGLVPRLVRLGYRGPVYATGPTSELLKILWADSAHIQEMEAKWQTRKNKRKGAKPIEPLYEGVDAEIAGELVQAVEMGADLRLIDGVEACFVSAGHILGAASLLLTLTAGGKTHHVAFSGDIGRPGQLLVPDPEHLPPPDVLFMETTYGNRRHKTLPESQKELVEVIHQAYEEGGKVLIPAFAVERTQEIIYTLAAAHRDGLLPDDMPVFLDSPLAIRATEIFRRNYPYFDDATTDIINQGHTPLDFPNLKFTLSTEESMAINDYKGPAVIMAGNGMASAGRIKHHMKHNLWRKNCHMVIVGFQAKGTTGRLLVEGAKKVKIFREDVVVGAQVHTINGFSAHADQEELLTWLGSVAKEGMRVNLMHGEETASLEFKAKAQATYPDLFFHVPRMGETLDLEKRPHRRKPHPAKAAAPEAQAAQPQAPGAPPAADEAGLLAQLDELRRLVADDGERLDSARVEQLAQRLAEARRLLQAGEAA